VFFYYILNRVAHTDGVAVNQALVYTQTLKLDLVSEEGFVQSLVSATIHAPVSDFFQIPTLSFFVYVPVANM